jgi:hypothetical protein
MDRKFLGLTVRTWLEYLAATVLGNLIYFYSLEPHLPDYLRHNNKTLDMGSLIDFIVCSGLWVDTAWGEFVRGYGEGRNRGRWARARVEQALNWAKRRRAAAR